MFHGAQNFVIAGGTFVNANPRADVSPLQDIPALADHCTHEAAYNSVARQHKPDCHPNTRTQHIQDITSWGSGIVQGQKEPHIIWMRGPVGVGKTAIAQTCARRIAVNRRLGASFFFSRNTKADDPVNFFSTIAHQIAVQLDSYRSQLEKKIKRDSTFFSKRQEDLFRELIVLPFLELKNADIPQMAVIIDGLDECKDVSAQVHIIELVAKSVKEHGDVIPLRWAFFSRPEPPIFRAFSHESVAPLCRIVELPVSRELDAEIRIYLRGALQMPHSVLDQASASPQWPPEDNLDALVHMSAGLFIYAAAIARFIMAPSTLDPEKRLDEVLLFHSRLQDHAARGGAKSNPVAELDEFYHMIMNRIPVEKLPIAQLVLLLQHALPQTPFLSTLPGGSPWANTPPVRLLANILGIKLGSLETSLSDLHSVLAFRQAGLLSSEQWGSATIYFHHASFMDFLTDSRRSQKMSVIDKRHWTALAGRCVHLLNEMHLLVDIRGDHKTQRLRKLVIARPNEPDIERGVLDQLFGEVYQYLRWNLFKWCTFAELTAGGEVLQGLLQFDYKTLGRLATVEVEADILDRFISKIPLNERHKIIRKGTVTEPSAGKNIGVRNVRRKGYELGQPTQHPTIGICLEMVQSEESLSKQPLQH